MKKVRDFVFMILARLGFFDNILIDLPHEHKSTAGGTGLSRRRTHS